MPEDIQTPGSLLADRFYAPKPVAEKTPEPTPEITPEPIPEVTDDVVEKPDEVSEESSEESSEGSEDDGVELKTFEELAEHLEADPEYLQNLTISQKVNGETIQVKISDALQSHRKFEAADSFLADAKVKAKAIVNEVREQKESLGESMAVAAAVLKDMEKQLDADVSSVNWAKLRADDPAEYTARRQDIDDRRKAYDANVNAAKEAYKKSLSDMISKEEQARLANLPEEHKRLVELVPEWQDEGKASAERPEVQKYMLSLGLSDAEIQNASFRGPYLALAIKAMRYDNAKGKTEAAKKKVVKIPKIIKPGAKPDDSGKPKLDPSDRQSILYGQR